VSQQNKFAIVYFVVGEKLDQERLETKPLLEKGISEHEVTIENDMSSKEDLNQYFPKSNESSVNDCAEEKKAVICTCV
jgi:hypothetical protein